MNYDEILEKLKELYPDGVSEFAQGRYDIILPGIGYVQVISREVDGGGYEYSRDTITIIKYFREHDIYIRIEGSVDSYSSNTYEFYRGWEGCTQVKPEYKQVQFYESVK